MEHLTSLGQTTGAESSANPTQSNVTQLEFTQAMKDFKIMFPAMDEDVIEIVLRANQGAVDATIDQLLQMSGEEAQKNRMLPSRSTDFAPKYTPPPSYNQSVPPNVNQLGWTEPDSKVNKEPINKSLIEHHHHRSQPEERSPLSSDSSSLRSWHLNRRCLASRFGWNPPLLGSLPANFLRFDNCVPAGSSAIPIPGQASTSVVDGELSATATSTSPLSSALLQQKMQENERQRLQLASSLDDAEAAQYLEDERIAIFLQNEEFVSELRRNKEFMSALHYDAMRGRNSTSTATSSSSTSANGFCNENYTGDLAGNSQYEHTSHESDADFKEKLKNMGKASRRKFAQLAGLFNRRKPAIPSRDNLLLGGEDAYTQLENDSSDTEDHHNRRQIERNARLSSSHK